MTGRDTIAKKLKDYRDKHKLNQFEFAEECGISRETLSLIERCKTNLSMDTLDLLAVRMDVTLSELLSNEITYFLIDSKLSYGIGAIKDCNLVDCILDVSPNEKEVRELIEKFNREQLDVSQLHNAVKKSAE